MVGGYVEGARLQADTLGFLRSNSFLNIINTPLALQQKTVFTPEEALDAAKFFAAFPEIQYVLLGKQDQFHRRYNSFNVLNPWFRSQYGAAIFEDNFMTVYSVGGDVEGLDIIVSRITPSK